MDANIIIALISFAGTLLGTYGGIMKANQLTNYRIQQLELKVEAHNKVIDRVYKLEKNEAVMEEEIEHLRKYHEQ